MKTLLALALLIAAPAAAQIQPPLAKYPHVEESSFKAPDGSRTLEESVVIDAPAAVLWRAYVEPKEFARWNAPMEAVDLRVGGAIEASYDAGAKVGDPDNIKHRLITWLPGRLLVFQNIQAPKSFPHPEVFQRTVITGRYEPQGPSRTRVVIAVSGWGSSPADDQLYGFFRSGDAELLEKLRTVYGGAPAAAAPAAPDPVSASVHDSSFTAADGQRTLQQWIDIRGPASCVWQAFTDPAALRASGISFARVELRNGGGVEEGFTLDPKPGETIRHQIITYLPESLLVLRNQATPTGLPGADLYPTIVQVISIEPQGLGVVRLSLAHTGYGAGGGYDDLYGFFRAHNPAFLTGAKARCEAPAAHAPG